MFSHWKKGDSAKLPSIAFAYLFAKIEQKYKEFSSATQSARPESTIIIVDISIIDNDVSEELTYRYELLASDVKSKEFTFKVTGFKTSAIDNKEKEQAKIDEINPDDIKAVDQIINTNTK